MVLHGTDTMAYTASALSFMLENLGKPVILTGSQVWVHSARRSTAIVLSNFINQGIGELVSIKRGRDIGLPRAARTLLVGVGAV